VIGWWGSEALTAGKWYISPTFPFGSPAASYTDVVVFEPVIGFFLSPDPGVDDTPDVGVGTCLAHTVKGRVEEGVQWKRRRKTRTCVEGGSLSGRPSKKAFDRGGPPRRYVRP
jgi:hypothetical protein